MSTPPTEHPEPGAPATPAASDSPATPTVKKAGRPPLTDRAAILGAARALGFEGLTVGMVTAKVGVKYSTFYRHFPSLGALRAAMLDDVLDDLGWPEPAGSWHGHLVQLAGLLRTVSRAHPGLTTALRATSIHEDFEPPPALIAARDRAVQVLVDHGYPPEAALRDVRSLIRDATADPFDQDPWPDHDAAGPPAGARGSSSLDDDEHAVALMLDGVTHRMARVTALPAPPR